MLCGLFKNDGWTFDFVIDNRLVCSKEYLGHKVEKSCVGKYLEKSLLEFPYNKEVFIFMQTLMIA